MDATLSPEILSSDSKALLVSIASRDRASLEVLARRWTKRHSDVLHSMCIRMMADKVSTIPSDELAIILGVTDGPSLKSMTGQLVS